MYAPGSSWERAGWGGVARDCIMMCSFYVHSTPLASGIHGCYRNWLLFALKDLCSTGSHCTH